jgi:hypothetical protein
MRDASYVITVEKNESFGLSLVVMILTATTPSTTGTQLWFPDYVTAA